MTEQQAFSAATKEFIKSTFDRVTDYKNLYVFSCANRDGPLQNPIAVEKDTGKVFIFHPLLNDPEAYFRAVAENGHCLQESSYDQKLKAGAEAVAHALKRGEMQ